MRTVLVISVLLEARRLFVTGLIDIPGEWAVLFLSNKFSSVYLDLSGMSADLKK
jgi:hypothetical protein